MSAADEAWEKWKPYAGSAPERYEPVFKLAYRRALEDAASRTISEDDPVAKVSVGDVFLNRRSGHKWRVLDVGVPQYGINGSYRMVTLRNLGSHNIKSETDLYLLNPDVHSRVK